MGDYHIFIIIPVYNVEKYLARCIESVLAQTYRDFTLILVDDGSSDSSLEICRNYTKKDQRIIVLKQEHAGVSAARNRGLNYVFSEEVAENSYISFIDSDDWIHKEYLRTMLKMCISEDVKIGICNRVRTDAWKIDEYVYNYQVKLFAPEDFWVKDHSVALTAWGKLYASSCWLKQRFPEGRIYEDDATIYKILFSVNQVAFTDSALYYYYINTGSLTVSTWTPKRLDRITAIKEQIDYFSQNNYENAYILSLYRICVDLIKTIRYIEVLYPDDKILMQEIKKDLHYYMKEYGNRCGYRKVLKVWFQIRYINRIKRHLKKRVE